MLTSLYPGGRWREFGDLFSLTGECFKFFFASLSALIVCLDVGFRVVAHRLVAIATGLGEFFAGVTHPACHEACRGQDVGGESNHQCSSGDVTRGNGVIFLVDHDGWPSKSFYWCEPLVGDFIRPRVHSWVHLAFILGWKLGVADLDWGVNGTNWIMTQRFSHLV